MRLVAANGCECVAAEDVAVFCEVTPDLGGLHAAWELAWAARRLRLAELVSLDDLLFSLFGVVGRICLFHDALNFIFFGF